MNPAYFSAIAALLGSAMGALGTIATTWLSQTFENRAQRRFKELAKREETYFRFIDLASQAYIDSLSSTFPDPVKLTPLFALIGKMRLFAPQQIVDEAETVVRRIINSYYRPPINFQSRPADKQTEHDLLLNFTKACRGELSV